MFNLNTIKLFVDMLRRNEENEEGQGLVEYALILVLISVVAITIMGTVGDNVSGVFSSISGALGGD